MKQNITFSADIQDIRIVRAQALQQGTTLNGLFQAWLKQHAAHDRISAKRFQELMDSVSYVRAGRKFTPKAVRHLSKPRPTRRP